MVVTVEQVRKRLRVRRDITDDEIQDLIDAALSDLNFSGMVEGVDNDTLVRQAVVTYAKANYGIDNPESEKFMASYESQKKALSFYGRAAAKKSGVANV